VQRMVIARALLAGAVGSL